ncbi:hypothetical protein ACFWDV_26380, partial [Streptomyces diastaticus]
MGPVLDHRIENTYDGTSYTDLSEPTGVDLARVALNAARAAAKRQGAEAAVQRRPPPLHEHPPLCFLRLRNGAAGLWAR